MLRAITAEELAETLELHRLWTRGLPEGRRANFHSVILSEVSFEGQPSLYSADFRGSRLVKVDFSKVDLHNADFSKAAFIETNFSEADLSAVDFSWADFRKVDFVKACLHEADFSGAKLFEVDFSGADIESVNFSKANLSGARYSKTNLHKANLQSIKLDFWGVLVLAPEEVAGLRLALVEGRVDGSTYEGACACLVGTIANVRRVRWRDLGRLRPDNERPAERFFLAIQEGDTPENNQVSAIVVAWIDEWIDLMRQTHRRGVFAGPPPAAGEAVCSVDRSPEV